MKLVVSIIVTLLISDLFASPTNTKCISKDLKKQQSSDENCEQKNNALAPVTSLFRHAGEMVTCSCASIAEEKGATLWGDALLKHLGSLVLQAKMLGMKKDEFCFNQKAMQTKSNPYEINCAGENSQFVTDKMKLLFNNISSLQGLAKEAEGMFLSLNDETVTSPGLETMWAQMVKEEKKSANANLCMSPKSYAAYKQLEWVPLLASKIKLLYDGDRTAIDKIPNNDYRFLIKDLYFDKNPSVANEFMVLIHKKIDEAYPDVKERKTFLNNVSLKRNDPENLKKIYSVLSGTMEEMSAPSKGGKKGKNELLKEALNRECEDIIKTELPAIICNKDNYQDQLSAPYVKSLPSKHSDGVLDIDVSQLQQCHEDYKGRVSPGMQKFHDKDHFNKKGMESYFKDNYFTEVTKLCNEIAGANACSLVAGNSYSQKITKSFDQKFQLELAEQMFNNMQPKKDNETFYVKPLLFNGQNVNNCTDGTTRPVRNFLGSNHSSPGSSSDGSLFSVWINDISPSPRPIAITPNGTGASTGGSSAVSPGKEAAGGSSPSQNTTADSRQKLQAKPTEQSASLPQAQGGGIGFPQQEPQRYAPSMPYSPGVISPREDGDQLDPSIRPSSSPKKKTKKKNPSAIDNDQSDEDSDVGVDPQDLPAATTTGTEKKGNVAQSAQPAQTQLPRSGPQASAPTPAVLPQAAPTPMQPTNNLNGTINPSASVVDNSKKLGGDGQKGKVGGSGGRDNTDGPNSKAQDEIKTNIDSKIIQAFNGKAEIVSEIKIGNKDVKKISIELDSAETRVNIIDFLTEKFKTFAKTLQKEENKIASRTFIVSIKGRIATYDVDVRSKDEINVIQRPIESASDLLE